MKNIALLLASGTGSRCGLEYPKQFVEVFGKTIIEHSVDVFENNEFIDEIVLVTSQQYLAKVKDIVKGYKKVSKVVVGGETRKDSSYNGISAIDSIEGKVLIHDAVRPLVSDDVVTECVKSLDIYDAICVTIPSVDTVYLVDKDNNIELIPNRKFVRQAQTPQCFKLSLIRKAHEKAKLDKNCLVTDDCGLIINYTDSKVHVIEGSSDNIKVTYVEDIEFVKSKLSN